MSDTEEEVAETVEDLGDPQGLVITDTPRLPIGILYEGELYRDVAIDAMTGVDEHQVAHKSVKNNGAKAITRMLRRMIQEIPGLVERKANPDSLIPEKFVRDCMFTPDRDFLLIMQRALSAEKQLTQIVTCPGCGERMDDDVLITELDVYDWEGDKPEFGIILPRGFRKGTEFHPELTWRFLTGKQQELVSRVKKSEQSTAGLTAGIIEVKGWKTRPSRIDVARLWTTDRNYLSRQVKDNTPGLDMRRNHECEDCEHEWEGAVDLAAFFNSGTAKARGPKNAGSGGRKKLRRR